MPHSSIHHGEIQRAADSVGRRMGEWRRELHRHPELAYEEFGTASLIVLVLQELGIEVVQRIGDTGVVGTLRRGDGHAIGLRADMDALPIQEETTHDHRSTRPGIMHACGHDGHVAMLLGGAALLVEDESWRGTLHFIFQPAEECGGGGRRMIEDGLFERFPCDGIYALHNWPGLPAGVIAVQPGPMMAALDTFEIDIVGYGTHAAMPENGRDPIIAASQLISAFQTIPSRRIAARESLVISVTQVHAGDAFNVIPEQAVLRGTVRCFSETVRDAAEAAMQSICDGVATLSECRITMRYDRHYPATINSGFEAELAARAGEMLVGVDGVRRSFPPSMASEDFSYMLNARPGAYAWIGAGEGVIALHNPRYDFNDALLPLGAAYWATLAKTALAAGQK